jgi:rare lipoprotein A (peptidoglycan hydrolase)
MEETRTGSPRLRALLAAVLATFLTLAAWAPPASTEPGQGAANLLYGRIKTPGKAWSKVLPAKKAKKKFSKRIKKQLENTKEDGGKVYGRLKLFRRYTFWGEASTYGSGWDGSPTACGNIYQSSAMTVAHKTLACGTKIVVTNPANGKAVTVTVNDRGPFADDRVLDLSGAAWNALTNGAPPGVTHVHARVT